MVSLVFYGSYPMSLELLKVLEKDRRFELKALVTAPETSKGKRPVWEWLREAAPNYPVFSPQSLAHGKRPEELFDIECDLVLACAYSLLIPPELRQKARFALNLHPSLLPELRGADPLRWVIWQGREKTGVSLLELSDGFDQGDIYEQWEYPLNNKTDLGSLYNGLTRLTALKAPDALYDIARGNLSPLKQDETRASLAPAFGQRQVDSSLSLVEIDRLVRANYPFSPAFYQGEKERCYLGPGRKIAPSIKAGFLARKTEHGFLIEDGKEAYLFSLLKNQGLE
jgi:methionyl-tRNA formyltransferase